MAFTDKSAENKRAAEKCMEIKAYNAGVTRAYYSAFQHIKAYLKGKRFNYKEFLQKIGSNDREFSHGTLRFATISCLMANGKKATDVYKLSVLDSLYDKRRKADYEPENIIEEELKTSLKDLAIVLSTVA